MIERGYQLYPPVDRSIIEQMVITVTVEEQIRRIKKVRGMTDRNHIEGITIEYRDGDKVFLRRGVNPYTKVHELVLRESWLKMLRGHIKDIQREIEEIEDNANNQDVRSSFG